MKKRVGGYTIVEVLTIVVVISILAGVSIVGYSGLQARARDSQRKDDFKNLQNALEFYKKQNNSYPQCDAVAAYSTSTNSPQTCTLPDAEITSGLKPDYISTVPSDPKTAGGYTYIVGRYISNTSTCAVSTDNTTNYVLKVTLESGTTYCVGSKN